MSFPPRFTARRRALLLAAACAAPLSSLAQPTLAQLTSPIPPGTITVSLKQAASISGPPLDLIAPPDNTDRLFIAGQTTGQVRLFKNNALITTPFLDVIARGITLSSGDEKGLLGTAFHPNFNAAPGT